MNFEDINFYQCSNTSKPYLGLHVRGYWVPKSLFLIAWTHALEEMPKLNWDVPQTTETLCGVTYWKQLKVGIRLSLGRCVKYFVDQEMLPLRVANPTKKGKRKYVRM